MKDLEDVKKNRCSVRIGLVMLSTAIMEQRKDGWAKEKSDFEDKIGWYVW